MSSAAPSKRALRLRLQAARVQERALPDHIRRAYGEIPGQPDAAAGDVPNQAELRESARASLVERGHLTREDLETLSVDDAIAVALQQLREQIAALELQSAHLADEQRGQADTFSRPPKILHRR